MCHHFSQCIEVICGQYIHKSSAESAICHMDILNGLVCSIFFKVVQFFFSLTTIPFRLVQK